MNEQDLELDDLELKDLESKLNIKLIFDKSLENKIEKLDEMIESFDNLAKTYVQVLNGHKPLNYKIKLFFNKLIGKDIDLLDLINDKYKENLKKHEKVVLEIANIASKTKGKLETLINFLNKDHEFEEYIQFIMNNVDIKFNEQFITAIQNSSNYLKPEVVEAQKEKYRQDLLNAFKTAQQVYDSMAVSAIYAIESFKRIASEYMIYTNYIKPMQIVKNISDVISEQTKIVPISRNALLIYLRRTISVLRITSVLMKFTKSYELGSSATKNKVESIMQPLDKIVKKLGIKEEYREGLPTNIEDKKEITYKN